MSNDTSPGTSSVDSKSSDPSYGVPGHSHSDKDLLKLSLGAIGIVFGDIGTSPLYALKECFKGHHQLPVDDFHIYGLVSLIFWTMGLVVTVKYVMFIMKADNKGEGGSMSLLSLIIRGANPKLSRWLIVLGVFATALFYGDSMITPAMSVLSAVEGLTVIEPSFDSWVPPVSVVILIGLFCIQARGTESVGRLFGPIMLVYFATLAILGAFNIITRSPAILLALNPYYAIHFFASDPLQGFWALGSVVLSVTGAEALYADMGHFGRQPISLGWYWVVFPALTLNYLGQCALLSADHEAIANPFYFLAPDFLRVPLIILATFAAVIASQAVITGAFSVTQQAIQLGYIPRLRVNHTSASTVGQIYIPSVNWVLMFMVMVLIAMFKNSTNLANAYGIAVTGTMFITSCMMGVLVHRVWHWKAWQSIPLVSFFLLIDGAFFLSNVTKIPEGGWFPLLVGFVVFTMLMTWSRGRHLMAERMRQVAMPIQLFIRSAAASAVRIPGTAIFLTPEDDGVPHALLHNLKHNKILHERVILLTVKIEDVPYVDPHYRASMSSLEDGFYRLIVRYGFMEEPDVPLALNKIEQSGPMLRMDDTSFFISRQTLIPSTHTSMAIWREKLFAWMLRNSESATEFFKLPSNRVVELGSQIELVGSNGK
ncbi:potassium transporter Kup [Zymomonas mobilis subsp. mobilis ZM4 = ATCC 31821]|uniref:Probable potassium transport system protein Kup n=1 Tax=Zymomonas mobilis subsp. mobilis (strain ATCC 31821 / ZM4 / CP4) TaxID=264203 RepID=KUP_ZYMMO|nr:potassium transporter Kup [Zymomonas mobilis]Q5NN77.1 RecName: Full=Probable potassium transport system protein Kup [Zymomonas mobilis subsp. mobilis ZM4 = ATCC 31821]AAV89833.1 potassium transporter [Zymomonas mobilis subsp. mobilis ZM4 = ATCC 31821]AHB09461.1 K+ transporter [Zymomonas mobilis subsp. mobilis str. CP4 = NRRL B-14023]AHJ69767.1 potassium transport protein Kup [Zymomonas mobilis subsp. mobilis NRRL B-12526]AHJ71623.1 potassium transport protein Kup [Zymomonas mobilis subsp. m